MKLNKDDIFDKLKTLNLDKDKFIVISGASMVVQNIKKETNDIEIIIDPEIEEELISFSYKIGFTGNKVYMLNDIELFIDWYDETDYVIIDGYKFATLESILKLKKELNRKKDLSDIKALDLALCLKDNYRYEKELISKGITLIAGVDEVGRGPLVGPVVASAVILPLNYKLEGLTDSKKLTEKKREEYYDIIYRDAISVGVGIISEDVIDEVNIYEATKMAMKEALKNLSIKPEHILIDAMPLDIENTTSIIKGDLKSLSISAASVIAKVTRDRMLDTLHEKYPHYNFKKNKGYPTKEHIDAINKYGIIKEHRKSYGPVKDYIGSNNL